MEDRRTAIAILLCIFVVMFYSEVFISPLTRQAAAPAPTTAAAPSQTGSTTASPVSSSAAPSQAAAPINLAAANHTSGTPPTAEQYARAAAISMSNGLVRAKINMLGGRVMSWKIDQYKLEVGGSEPLDLVSVENGKALPLAVFSAGLSDEHVMYSVASLTEGCAQGAESIVVPSGKECYLNLLGQLSNGVRIKKQFIFRPNSYLFDLEVELSAPPADGSPLWLDWSEHVLPAVHTSKNPANTFTILDPAGKIQHVAYHGGVVDDLPVQTAGSWAALNSLYFTAAVVSAKPAEMRLRKSGDTFEVEARAENSTGGKYQIYLGPKNFEILQSLGLGLERTIDLGWFAFLSHPLLALLRFFYSIFGNYGLAIISLTLLIKLVFLPLNTLSFRSMKAMQDLQPEMKALRERVKDPNQLNQEMMALYKKRGVNPMGGCLPILVQIPVFFGLYSALQHAIELRHSRFALWVHDLSAPESLQIAGVPVPVMVLLFGLSMFLQVYTSPKPADPMQAKINLAMPVVFTVMFVIFPFPAGLVVYWLTNNVISIVQQMYLRRGPNAKPLIPTLITALIILGFAYTLTLI